MQEKKTNNNQTVPIARVAQLMSLGCGYAGAVTIGNIMVNIIVDIERRKDLYNCSPMSNKEITPWGLGVEWLLGIGPRHRNFIEGDCLTELLQQHEHIQKAKQIIKNRIKLEELLVGDSDDYDYKLNGIQGITKYVTDYSTLATLGNTGNLAATFLGSYRMTYIVTEITKMKAKVKFVVSNSSSMQSASRPPVIGYEPIWTESVGKYINNCFESGWGSMTTQTIIWYEEIEL